MIKSYKIILIVQFIVLLIFSVLFHKIEYGNDFAVIPTVPLLLIGFSPFILLIISIIIQRLIAAIIYSDSTGIDGDKEKPNDKFWRNSFFTNVVFGVAAFVLSIVAIAFHFSIGIKGFDFADRLSVFLGIILIASAIIGLFFRIKDSVNEISKLLGGLMILISAVIFAGSLFVGVENMLNIQFSANESIVGTLNTVPETEEETVSNDTADEEYVEESETDYYGFNEMSFPEIKTNEYFRELFEDQNYDETKINDLAKLFLSSFLELENNKSFAGIRRSIERGFAYHEEINTVDKKIRRNPEAIRRTFDSYNTLFYAFLSKKIYFDSNLNLIVNALLDSHEDIYKTENPEETLNKIYKTMVFGEKKEFPDYYYKELNTYASEEFLNTMSKNAETHSDKDENSVTFNSQLNTVWIYSFWARRYKEKNNEVVFEILKEIKEHYNEN